MTTNDRTDVHLDAPMLAKRWHTSEQSLAQRRYLKQPPAWIYVGRRVLYPIADIEAFEAENRSTILPRVTA